MRRILAIVVLLTAIGASESFAQPPVTADASVTLQVSNVPVLTKIRDLQFAPVYTGTTTAAVDPITGGTAAAAFDIQGPNSAVMTLTYPASITLTDASSNTLTVAPAVSGLGSNTQGSSSAISSGSSFTTASSGSTVYWFWAGGTATISPTQATGTYTGTLTLSVAY